MPERQAAPLGARPQWKRCSWAKRISGPYPRFPVNWSDSMKQQLGNRLLALILLMSATLVAQRAPSGLTFERLRNAQAEPSNWLTYWGDYQGTHFFALKQINAANAAQLKPAWSYQLTENGTLQATPLVIDGVMYTTGSSGNVFALDAKTGREIWKYQRKQKVVNPNESNRHNRGVAALGNRIFFGTLDAA